MKISTYLVLLLLFFNSFQPVGNAAMGIQPFTGDPVLKIGDKAPDFQLKNIDGKFYKLSELMLPTGKKPNGYIIVFTCNTCPYAQAYEERIISLHEKMLPKGYPVVAIQPNNAAKSPGDSFSAMKSKNYSFLYLHDEKQEVFPAFGASRTPEVYLLDQDFILRYTGAIDNNAMDQNAVTSFYVEEAVKAIEAGKKPETESTRAVGCSIKR